MRTAALFFFVAISTATLGCGRIAEIDALDDADAGGLGEPADAASSPPADGGLGMQVDGASGDAAHAGDTGRVKDAQVDTGVRVASGRCITNADCGQDGTCFELVPGGYRVCSYPPPAPRPCTQTDTNDECCASQPCDGGTCALEVSCGGAFITPHNMCEVSACETNVDCGANGICLPTGVGDAYRRTCLTSNACLYDADCQQVNATCALIGTTGPGDQCGLWSCLAFPTEQAYGMRCLGPGECASDHDCPGGHCEQDGPALKCMPGVRPTCPPPP
jgi:hypothetical protein